SAEPQRTREVLVRGEEVMRLPDAIVLFLLQDLVEDREIELGLVDRLFALLGRRPTDARIGGARRLLREVLEVAQLSFGDAQELEAVERRRTRGRLFDVDPRIRD